MTALGYVFLVAGYLAVSLIIMPAIIAWLRERRRGA